MELEGRSASAPPASAPARSLKLPSSDAASRKFGEAPWKRRGSCQSRTRYHPDLNLRYKLNLNGHVARQASDLDRSARRRIFGEELCIDIVHSAEISKIPQIHRGL